MYQKEITVSLHIPSSNECSKSRKVNHEQEFFPDYNKRSAAAVVITYSIAAIISAICMMLSSAPLF